MKRVKLEELAAQQRGESYSELYERIRSELRSSAAKAIVSFMSAYAQSLTPGGFCR